MTPIDDHPTISVVIPVYQEGRSLDTLAAVVFKELTSLQESFEIIFIDDGSSDNTWSVIQNLSLRYPQIRGASLSRNFGKELALCAGLELAKGAAVITMDGDLQHPPELIPELVRAWHATNADVVEAVKQERGKESLINRLGAKAFYYLLNRLTGYDLRGASDYKLLDRRVLAFWQRMPERSVFFRGMIAWLGFRHVQISFSVPERADGLSRWSFVRLIALAVTAVTAFSSLPLRLVTFGGIAFFIMAVVLAVQTLARKMMHDAVSGFTTVILLQLIVGSALLIGLGIIGEYVSRIYEEVKGRPRYILSETINMGSSRDNDAHAPALHSIGAVQKSSSKSE